MVGARKMAASDTARMEIVPQANKSLSRARARAAETTRTPTGTRGKKVTVTLDDRRARGLEVAAEVCVWAVYQKSTGDVKTPR